VSAVFSTFGFASRGFVPLHQGCPLHFINLYATARQDASPVLAIEDLQECTHKMCYVFYFFSRLTE